MRFSLSHPMGEGRGEGNLLLKTLFHLQPSSHAVGSGNAPKCIGNEKCRCPVALKIALAIAGARISFAGSPMLLAPVGETGSGFSTMIAFISGKSIERGIRYVFRLRVVILPSGALTSSCSA